MGQFFLDFWAASDIMKPEAEMAFCNNFIFRLIESNLLKATAHGHWMRERGESPHCTAAVSVETGIAAKADQWETEKVETGRRSMAP